MRAPFAVEKIRPDFWRILDRRYDRWEYVLFGWRQHCAHARMQVNAELLDWYGGREFVERQVERELCYAMTGGLT